MSRLDDAYALVAISSVSRHENELASHVEKVLRSSSTLDVERIGDNVVARTTGHHATRIVLAGHLDTVPGEARDARVVGEVLRGVGACDMKGSLAVMVALATDPEPRSVEVTWIFYAREEIARADSGLSELAELRPDLVHGDLAVLAEPTGGAVEAGCQGSLKVNIELRGARAHVARPFTGRNAIHRMGEVIARVASYVPREVVIDGVTFIEQLQAVNVQGGVALNVVPDVSTLTLNHRVAPDRGEAQAVAWLREYVGALVDEGDSFTVLDWAPGALPSLDNERLATLVEMTDQPARAKMGWTDVATFQELAIPATNFGAGDPHLAHRSDEFVTLSELVEFERVLRAWLA